MDCFELHTIKVLVTSYCNLNCKHCYQYYDKNKYQIPIRKLYEIADFAVEKKVKTLDLGGGEFFTYRYAYDLLEYCFEKNIKVNIATNAIDLNIPFFIKHKSTQSLTIQISIDGTEQSHDNRRGIGTFNKTIENVKLLYELGIPLTASMALDEYNYKDMIEVLKLPYFEKIYFLPVAYVGASKINNLKSMSKEYENVICEIMKNMEYEPEEFLTQIFPNTLAIKYDGKVYPSPVAADYNLFCLGNIREKSIKDIVERYYFSEEFQKLLTIDNLRIAECNECTESQICGRGCRMRSMKFWGDPLKPDPFCCRIYKNSFSDIPISKLFWGER